MSSADVWRRVIERQQRFGNSQHVMENEAGNECLEGSMSHLRLSSSEVRRARQDFVRVVGEGPSPFNDHSSSGGAETTAAAQRVVDELEAAQQPSAVSAASGGRRGLPAGQSWLTGAAWAPEREKEAVR